MLILDFDGVVVDTERVHFESWNAALDEIFGVRLAGDHRQIVGLTLDQLYDDWTVSGLIQAEWLDDATRRRLLARKTDYFFEIGSTQLHAAPGVADLVRRAQSIGWYAAIASRGRRNRLLRTLELVRLPVIFELVLSSDDIVDPATDRKVHSRAAEMLGADPAECVVVEDSEAGVSDARNAGIGWVIGITSSVNAADLFDAGADEVVDTLQDVHLPPPVRP